MTDETKGNETPPFRIENRGGIDVVVDSIGCRPATDAETEFSAEIDRLTALVATEKERADTLELAHSASTLSERRDLTAALQDERERCAKAVCEFCKEGDERTMSNGRLKHIYGRTLFPCKAEPIRSLPPTSGQDGTKTSEPDEQTAALLSEREQVKELREALQLVVDTYGFDSSTDSVIWQTAFAALARSPTQPQMSDSDLTEGGAR